MRLRLQNGMARRAACVFLLAAGLICCGAVCAADGDTAVESFHRMYTDSIRSAALVPGGVFGFFEPGEEVTLRLVIDGTAKDYAYTLTVTDDTGKVVFTQEKTALTPEIKIPGQVRGYYSAESDIYADGVKAYTIQGGFAVAPVPGKRDPFFVFGQGVIPELHDGYRRVGCGTIQMKLDAFNIDAFPMPRDRGRKARYYWNMYAPYLESGDFHLQVCLSTGPKRKSVRTPEELEAGYPLLHDDLLRQYLDFLEDMQPLMKTKEWFIGQETPSHATVKNKLAGTWSEAMGQFVVVLRMGSRKLKKLDPEIRIFAGGNNVMGKMETIEPVEMGDVVKDFDCYYIDGYTGNWDLTKGKKVQIPEIDLMKFYRKASALSVSLGKGKYIVNNETGYSVPYGARFDRGLSLVLAQFTARNIIISKAAPLLYLHVEKPNAYPNRLKKDPADSDGHMTMVWKCILINGKCLFVPMPAGAMYVTATSELAFAKFEREIIRGSVYSYVFAKPDGSALVTLWNTEKEQSFAWNLPSGSTVLNIFGRDITGQPLVIGPSPVYITIPGAAANAAKAAEKAIEANTPEAVCTALPSRVYIKNLTSETREGEIRIPGQAPVKVKLLPGKVSTFDLPVPAPGELVIGSRTYEIPLEKTQTIRLKHVSSTEKLRRTEPGLLHYPDHIRPVDALQPERCYFKTDFNPNGHNVSAKYWAGYDEKNFYFAAEVDDPVHIQRNTGMNIWQDDSLQFVVSPADYPPASMIRLTNGETPRSEYNFALALTSQGPQLVKFGGKDAGPKPDWPAKVTREGDLTRYELAIPWSSLGGRAKRFGFLIWDNNSMSEPRAPYRLEFTPGIANGQNSSLLAEVEYE